MQVTLNQLALAPVTLAAVFAWNLGWTGQTALLKSKIQHDLIPSMINGMCATMHVTCLLAVIVLVFFRAELVQLSVGYAGRPPTMGLLSHMHTIQVGWFCCVC